MFRTLYYDNRQLLLLSLLIIATGGVSALWALPRLEDPRIKNRNPIIVTTLPGASAERVEALVTERLEEELREVPEIKEIESDSRANVSLIKIELKDNVDDTIEVFTRLRDKLADVESELPPSAGKPDFDDQRGAVAFTLIVGVTWDHPSEPVLGVLGRTAEELATRLRNLSGTDVVRRYGVPDEEITVTLDRDKLAHLGLTVAQVTARVQAADSKIPAGMFRSAERDMVIEVRGDFQTLDRIREIPLQIDRDGQAVRLGEVAVVERSYRNPPTEIGLMNGKRTVYVAARMLSDRRVDVWVNQARAVTREFQRTLSPTMQLVEVFDQNHYTSKRLGELGSNLILGAGVVMLVIFVMMGWRSSLLVGLSLPLVSAMVLFAMLVMGIPLHQMSVFGLIVAMGLLIDNAIVMVDDVAAQMKQGKPPRSAIAVTVGHLSVPLLGSTLTTVVAFLPILLLPGSVGEFVGTIATTVILALIFSLFVSMTIIPALTGWFGHFSSDKRWYRHGLDTPRLAGILRWTVGLAVRRPMLGILLAVSLPAVGFMRLGDLGNQFFPAADRDQFHIQVWMPRGTSIWQTSRTVQRMERQIREAGGVTEVNWLVGGSVPTVYYNMIMDQDRKPSYAQAVVTAKSAEHAKRLISQLQSHLDQQFPQAQTVVKALGQGPPVEAPVEVRVSGPSVAQLKRIGQDLQRMLLMTPQVVHTQTSFDVAESKLWVEADEVQTRLAGLTLGDLAVQLQSTLEGNVAGTVLEQTEELPVRLRLDDSVRADLDQIATSKIVLPRASVGDIRWTPLSSLGDLTLKPQTASIHRRNGERSTTVKAYVDAGALAPEVTQAFLERMEAEGYELPSGYTLDIGGDAEELRSAMSNLFRFAPVLLVIMITTVVLSFRSFALAGILGGVAASSAGLAFLSLWVAGFPLGFNPLIGMAGLIGIALNDSIVVLAQIRTNAAARSGVVSAIVDEVMKTSRHVLSTTLTTIGGFVPLLIGGGDFWPPLAIVIAGGVGGASILALLFVPAGYVLLRPWSEIQEVAPSTIGSPSGSNHGR
ncbi:MAG: efflux RND transporter permease subunit [Planctomycetota bacterium]